LKLNQYLLEVEAPMLQSCSIGKSATLTSF
jgi:hypothetical protein